MYFGNVWDWNFFWSVFQNFLASGASFVLIVVAALVVGILLRVVVNAIRGAGK
ncbi:PTS ascorbate transporter subunit IIC [Alicyclobacillaceae bacterium I2511]|nr:PTS ascorbate transporter subunit IIC [Alicyclobacillaceae bacterium I2511]